MKVLWITNVLLPDACEKLGVPTPVIGGWLASSLDDIIARDVEMGVATLYEGNSVQSFEKNGVQYFLIPAPENNYKYCPSLQNYWKFVDEKFKPDLIHLHGTEFAHGLSYIRFKPHGNFIVSIQGLVSVIQKYYYAGITIKNVFLNISLRDIIRKDSIFQQRTKMHSRGIVEREILRGVHSVIGRTSWDKAHTAAINRDINYYFCNESLRLPFYGKKWDIEKCEKHSIFLSQANYPVKGLHQVLRSLPLILPQYPNTKVYIAGSDITHNITWKDKIRISGYGLYIKRLIKTLKLESHVFFLGPLDQEEMVSRFLQSNVFVCPSSIENSSNSLGEAQLLGVPSVASYVGGTPDMITHGKTGFLYRFEEIEMLASLIMQIFEMPTDELRRFSSSAQATASARHRRSFNAETLVDIYRKCII